ncbi:MAG: radical SAM protein [Deltaproteobacteria bacterium]
MANEATPYSNLKIFAHPDRLEAIKNSIRTAPVYIRLKPTNVCNHRCFYCSYADDVLGLRDDVKAQDSIPWDKMQEIIGDFREMGIKAVTLSGGGEPLTYPHIEDTMELILQSDIDLSIITNGQMLIDRKAELLARAKWVRISADAAATETYSAMRNISLSSFAKVCSNIEKFAALKNPACELGINFVINHQNQNEVYAAAALFKSLGANHIKYTARITRDLDDYHQPFQAQVIGQIHRAIQELADGKFSIINKYEDDFGLCAEFHRKYNKCYLKEFVSCIAADSKVYFCHDKAYVSSGVVGDLSKTSFKELWFSPEVTERYKNFDAEKECDHHCVYDDRNLLLNTFFSLNRNHINFI